VTAVPAELRPYRVVDRYQRGWLTAVDPCTTYPPIGGSRVWTLAALEECRAPLRPVVAAPTTDRDALVAILAEAGRDAVSTVAAALYRVARACYTADGHDARMVAGRPGSWESMLLPRVAWEIGIDIAGRRVHPRALAVCERTIHSWVFTAEWYVEVAENLASVLGEVVTVRGGYPKVCDQWIRQHALADRVEAWVTSTV
jgi:hypothetical protein